MPHYTLYPYGKPRYFVVYSVKRVECALFPERTLMNTIFWLAAGGILAWIAFVALRMNNGRGLVISVVIGAMGAYVGGSVIAPLLANGPPVAGAFALFPLLVASASAAACLLATDMIYDRFEV